MNNRDDFEDYEVQGSRINYTANGKTGKLTDNVMVGKCINSGDKGSSYGFTKCDGSEDSESEVIWLNFIWAALNYENCGIFGLRSIIEFKLWGGKKEKYI